MIRAGQMLLHESLKRHTLDNVIELFFDRADLTYSIHNICNAGLSLNKQPGEWYGPQTILQALYKIGKQKPFDSFRMVICEDGCVYWDKLEKKVLQK